MARIEIQIQDREVLDLLGQISQRLGSPAPMLKLVGETLVDSTKQRFRVSRSPDNTAWEKNSPDTIEAYVAKFKSSFTKSGELSKAGSRRAAGKKPLIGETRALGTTINYRVVGDTLYVGSPMEYAATHQFGAKMGQYGRYSQLFRRTKYKEGDFRRNAGTVKGFPIPWADIPPRPFLGLSAGDRAEVLALLRELLLP